MTKLKLLIQQRKRRKSFLDSSLRLDGITTILESTHEKRRWNELYRLSGISMKKSFIKYLSYCVDKNLVVRTEDPDEKCLTWFDNDFGIRYTITDKGRQFLELVR